MRASLWSGFFLSNFWFGAGDAGMRGGGFWGGGVLLVLRYSLAKVHSFLSWFTLGGGDVNIYLPTYSSLYVRTFPLSMSEPDILL